MTSKSKIITVFLLLWCLVPFRSLTDSDAVAATGRHRSLTLLDTRHKFPPEENKAESPGSHGEVVNLFPSEETKQRPEARPFRRDVLSEEGLRRRLSSRSVILIDGRNGQVIFEQLPDLPAQPASTIKVLTAMIAIQSLHDRDLVPVSRHAANMPRSKVYLERGKSYHADDLINAVLLSSANDASVALAEKIGGTEKTFARLMTQKARAWGATDTLCRTATGLTARGQHTTARDLANLFNRAMGNEEFATRVAQSRVRTTFGMVLHNHNKALWEIDGTEGGKTGYTCAARQTYVGKFKRGDDELLLALLGSETMWDDVKNLVNYGFEALAAQDDVRRAQTGTHPDSRLMPVVLEPNLILQVLSDSKKSSVL